MGDYESALFNLEQALGDTLILQAPDLVASIREQLSVAYAAIDDKPASDHNLKTPDNLDNQERLESSEGAESPENRKNRERLEYIRELTEQIESDNTLLTQWIQLRQGELSLHIESFPLQSVFDIVAHGRMSFQLKGLTLDVTPTEAVVKADRILTLFMLNTLADNARKFTPRGGQVGISSHRRRPTMWRYQLPIRV